MTKKETMCHVVALTDGTVGVLVKPEGLQEIEEVEAYIGKVVTIDSLQDDGTNLRLVGFLGEYVEQQWSCG